MSGSPRPQQHERANGGRMTTVSCSVPRCTSNDRRSSDDPSGEVRMQNDAVSPLVSLVSTDSMGRHVVAGAGAGAGAGAIPAGTVLLRETPFAWSLHPEFNGEICAHCLCEIASSVVLCTECGYVAYCSTACSTAALGGWHGDECQDACSSISLGPVMSGMSPACKVALRAFRRARQRGVPPPDKAGESEDEAAGPEASASAERAAAAAAVVLTAAEVQGTCPSRPSSVASSRASGDGDELVAWPVVKLSHLQEHYSSRSARERDVLETEAALAAVLAGGPGGSADCDDQENGATSGSGRHATRAGTQVCGLLAADLVTTLVKVSTNAFTVSSLRCSESSAGRHVQPLNHAKVAVGLYLAASMLNHSCRPNALATFHGGEMRVVATRAIETGEPVTISYGPLASKIPSTSERQAFLRRAYFFRCECAACCPPAARAAATPSRRPGGGGGDDEQQLAARDRGRGRRIAAAAARSKLSDFPCSKVAESGGCPGTLLVGVSPPLSPPTTPSPAKQDWTKSEDGVRAVNSVTSTDPEAAVEPASPSSPSSSSSVRKMEAVLWCDRCGNRVSSDLADALLKEDEEDRWMWDKATAAMSHSEGGEGRTCGGDGEGVRIMPPPRPSRPNAEGPRRGPSPDGMARVASSSGSCDSADALSLLVERIRWRESHLTAASMRRAVAHDMHARILANLGDFPGAADACARAVSVLKRRFEPSDQELGAEFLKLAGLCFNAGWTDKCSAACVKARMSLGVCLRPDDEQLVVLNTLQALCAAASHR